MRWSSSWVMERAPMRLNSCARTVWFSDCESRVFNLNSIRPQRPPNVLWPPWILFSVCVA